MQHTEAAPRKRRHEIVRILMYLGITVAVQALTYLCALPIAMFGPASTMEELDRLLFAVYLIFWTIGPGIAAICNRRFTFRVKDRWWWLTPLAMMVLNLVFSVIMLPVSNFISDALGWDFSSLFSWGLGALWLILQYILQRFVLHRKTLDTLPDPSAEKEAANA